MKRPSPAKVIFDVPVRELFAGLYEKVERLVRRRVKALTRRLRKESGPAAAGKLAFLERLASRIEAQPRPSS